MSDCAESAFGLPLELLRCIFTHIDRTDTLTLLSLLLTSHAFKEESERILYHTFNSHRLDPTTAQWIEIPESSQLGFFQRIANYEDSDRVALYVYRVNMEQLSNIGTISREFWETLEKALRKMRNLETLAYFSWENRELSSILSRNPSSFQLKNLEWNCSGCDQDIQIFLPAQHSLRRLILSEWKDPTPVFAPGLKELRVSSKSGVLALVAGCGGKVKNLKMLMVHAEDVFEADELLSEEFLRGMRAVENLSTTSMWMNTLAHHFENVCSLDVWGSQPEDFSKLLRKIPNLRRLTLSQMNPEPSKKLIKEIFRRNRGIEAIDVRNSTIRCARWLRDAENPVEAPKKNFYSYMAWNNGSGEEEWVE